MDVNEELKFFVKIKKELGAWGIGSGEGCQGGFERRIDFFVKKIGGGVGGQGGCERRKEVFVKINNNKYPGLGVGERVWGQGRFERRIDFFFVKTIRGVGVGGQGGCERRKEVFVKINKK